MPVTRIGRLQLPVGGGGYFRLYPLRWTVRWLQAINHRDRRHFVFYCHPWEIDPDQPRLRAGSQIVLRGSRHEILQERDSIREQFWAAFDAFVPGVALSKAS